MTDPPIPAADGSRLRVLFYVDDSTHWEPGAQALGEVLRGADTEVTLLTTVWSSARSEEAFSRARAALGLPFDRVRTRARHGLVEYVLPEEAGRERYDLAVVGRLGSLDWLTNGLIAHLLVRRTPTSILLLRGRTERFRRILVCTEGPRHGMANALSGAAVARATGADLTVLHVLSQLPLTYASTEELARMTASFLERDLPEARHLREVGERLCAAGARASVIVRAGLVVESILSELQHSASDLLVLGAHDPAGKEGFLYQDIASLLVRASPTSQLVVRGAGIGPKLLETPGAP